jgi:hypothetical protein
VIILLNGASSAGKSTVARRLASAGAQVASWDVCALALYAERARELGFDGEGDVAPAAVVARLTPSERVVVCGDVAIGEIDRRLVAEVRRLTQKSELVAVDTILRGDDDAAELYGALANVPVRSVLITCDGLELVRRIAARNRSADVAEHRTLAQALVDVAQLYVPATAERAPVMRLPLGSLQLVIADWRRHADAATGAALDYVAQALHARFGSHAALDVAGALDYDVVVDTSAQSPDACVERVMAARDSEAAARNLARLATTRAYAVGAAEVERHVGGYHAGPGVVFDVSCRDGRLGLRLPGQRRLELVAAAPAEFVARAAPVRVRFDGDRISVEAGAARLTALRR